MPAIQRCLGLNGPSVWTVLLGRSWCTIESDPGVFSELIQAFGVAGAKVEECYSIDPETLGPLAPVYGLVFLFKHTGSAELRPGAVLAPEATDVFFANQVGLGA